MEVGLSEGSRMGRGGRGLVRGRGISEGEGD